MAEVEESEASMAEEFPRWFVWSSQMLYEEDMLTLA